MSLRIDALTFCRDEALSISLIFAQAKADRGGGWTYVQRSDGTHSSCPVCPIDYRGGSYWHIGMKAATKLILV